MESPACTSFLPFMPELNISPQIGFMMFPVTFNIHPTNTCECCSRRWGHIRHTSWPGTHSGVNVPVNTESFPRPWPPQSLLAKLDAACIYLGEEGTKAIGAEVKAQGGARRKGQSHEAGDLAAGLWGPGFGPEGHRKGAREGRDWSDGILGKAWKKVRSPRGRSWLKVEGF